MKKRTKSNYYFIAGIVIGCLAMGIYLFPSFFTEIVNNNTDLNLKVKSEVAAVSDGDTSWSEDWSITEWRTATLNISIRDRTHIRTWEPSGDSCEIPTGVNCLGDPWLMEYAYQDDECICYQQDNTIARSDPITIGPAKMKVTGRVNDNEFEETWTAGDWQSSNYESTPRHEMNEWMKRNDTIDGGQNIFVTFANLNKDNSNLKSEAIFVEHPEKPDNTKRVFYPLGEYGYTSMRWKETDYFAGKNGVVDSGRSMPTTWHVEGNFVNSN